MDNRDYNKPNPGYAVIYFKKETSGVQMWGGSMTLLDGTSCYVDMNGYPGAKKPHYNIKVRNIDDSWKTVAEFNMPSFAGEDRQTIKNKQLGELVAERSQRCIRLKMTGATRQYRTPF